MAKGKKNKSALYNPAKSLSGGDMRRVVNALTAISTRPAIRGQQTAIKSSRQAQRYDTRGLNRMGNRLDKQANYLSGRMDQYGNEGITNAQNNANTLQGRLAATNTAATDNLNQLQSNALGSAMSSLAGQNIQAGQSAGDNALARMAALQQGGQKDLNQSMSSLGAFVGNEGVAAATGLKQAGAQELQNQRFAMRRGIASRVADRQFEGQQERAGARSQLATLRGLKGAEKLKNTLELRREQQDYQNNKASILATTNAANADREVDWYKAVTGNKNDAAAIAARAEGGGGGGDLWDNPNRLSNQEYRQVAAAANERLGANGKVEDWSAFLDNLSKIEGINWSPVERRKFKRRFKNRN